MAKNPPAGVPRLFPRLCYRDVGAAIEFLTRAFGFEEHTSARIADPDGSVSLTDMAFGDGRIMLGAPGAHGLESPAELGGRTQMILVYVDDVDAHCARARREGADVLADPEDQPWGDRRYEAIDPEGHRWYFAEHVRDVAPEAWRRELGIE